jgi:ATP-binding cassette subfamily F protein uup
LVSHDRAFLDNVVTSIIAYEGDGFWREYEGGYEDWKIQKKRSEEYKTQSNVVEPSKVIKAEVAETQKQAPKPPKSNVQKLNSKERQELESIPGQIDVLEKEQAGIGEKLGDAELYKNQPEQVNVLQNRLKDIEEDLMTLMARWEDLLKRSEA